MTMIMPGTSDPVGYVWHKWGDANCEYCAEHADPDDMIDATPVYPRDGHILFPYCDECGEQTYRHCDDCSYPLFDADSFIETCICPR